ncbi:hypothetical protein [Actinoplanes sp. TFC3]|uniref:hypothetical protein n=1 Tax=Actinoplanes sp. TFC3 TaxID=1710355 RepID=UPI00082B3CDD|nr:hypothetical protein [Actinoplanes sp. TFC3]
MTDVEDAVEIEPGTELIEPGPELIATHYLTSIDDVVEHLRAASQLGLGVRVRSYLEQDEDGETLAERWELELLTTSPVHQDEEAGHADDAVAQAE